MLRTVLLSALAVFTACTATSGGSTSSSSSSSSSGMMGQPDAGPTRCDGGPCATTQATAQFGAASITLDVAYLGLEPTDAGLFFYVEAYRGAAPGCPQMNSPTPDQTLIVANVPAAPAGSIFTYEDGVRASLLDFQGDLFMGLAPARATALQVTVVDAETQPPAAAFVVLDVQATFADGGTLSGTLAATHCDSLD